MDVDVKKRRLPKGTSKYQAAWILDDQFSDEETEEVDLQSPGTVGGTAEADDRNDEQSWDEDMEDAEVVICNIDILFGVLLPALFLDFTSLTVASKECRWEVAVHHSALDSGYCPPTEYLLAFFCMHCRPAMTHLREPTSQPTKRSQVARSKRATCNFLMRLSIALV